jgi:hypothetical protein
MANPYLTQIELPSGSVYDLHDSRVDNLNNWEYVVCTDASNTPKDVTWDSGGTTITGTLVASADTMYKIYLVPDTNGTNDTFDEYITVNPSGSTYQWEMFGNTKLPDMNQYVKNKSGHSGGTAGDLAYKDSASGSDTVPKTYTSSTSVSTATTSAESVSVTGTTTGSVSLTKSTVDVKPNATGTASNKYTPAGTNASSSVSGSCTVTPGGSISVGTGTANYTPAGSITVATAGGTTTIKNPTSKTVVTDMSVSAPSATTATGELVYCEVSGTKLSLKKFVETTGASITTSNVKVKNGDASYSFSGTGAELKFTGSSSTGTISGTADAQTFTGTGTYLKTAVAVGTSASFTGASMTSTGSVNVPATYSATTTTTTNTTESKTVTVT